MFFIEFACGIVHFSIIFWVCFLNQWENINYDPIYVELGHGVCKNKDIFGEERATRVIQGFQNRTQTIVI